MWNKNNRDVLIVASAMVATTYFVLLLLPHTPPFKKSSSDHQDNEDKGENIQSNNQDVDDGTISLNSTNKEEEDEDISNSDLTHQLPPHLVREQMKKKRRKAKAAMLSMKTQMYDNVDMKDPNGKLLSKISLRKAKWYISKNLATWAGDNPNNESCIQINFEPKHQKRHKDKNPDMPDEYTVSIKENICVACGANQHHIRHYIVPFCYKTLFPNKYKVHLCHDIVILCPDCNYICAQQTQQRMKEIEEYYRKGNVDKKFTIDQELAHVRSAALALMNWKHQMPQGRIQEHEITVRNYFTKHTNVVLATEEDISKELLQQAIDVQFRIENKEYIPGPELVVDTILKSEEATAAFVREWRLYFLETMEPRFMPKGWDVDNPVIVRDE